MVYKLFCDKCNEEMKDGKDNELCFAKLRQRDIKFRYDERINLCDKCLKELEKWLYDRKGKDNEIQK